MCRHLSHAHLHFLRRFILGNVEVCNLFKLFLNVETPKHMEVFSQLLEKPEKSMHYVDCLVGGRLPSAIFSVAP